jgi:hypothetical protein
MHREILMSCMPYVVAMIISTVCLAVVARLSGGSLRLSRLRRLHRCEKGGVQSLSFVLTLPLFIMILMFIVQLSQLTIAKVVVENAALTTARSAMVWIPANLSDDGGVPEHENQIGPYLQWQRTKPGPDATDYDVYTIVPDGKKFSKLHFAAAMACMSICPSRDMEITNRHPSSEDAAQSILRAYNAYVPASTNNGRIPRRLANKLAYALDSTKISVEIHHRSTEPPLTWHDVGPYRNEFTPNEVGWQDQLVVTVEHDFALLPGPGRILARLASARPGTTRSQSYSSSSGQRDAVAERIETPRGIYVYPISATARLSNEGEKPILPYTQPWNGIQNYGFLPYQDQSFDTTSWWEERFYDKDEEYYWRGEEISEE